VQLIATAHGNTLDNLLLNPTLSDLLGGVESVTLSDEEARRRGTQKTILERRAPPTFDILIEIQDRQRLLIHPSLAVSVDALLRGYPLQAELRYRDDRGEVRTEQATPPSLEERESGRSGIDAPSPRPVVSEVREAKEPVRILPYGVARNRLERAARRMRVPVYLAKDAGQAEVLITTKGFYRKRPRIITDAERRGLPIYVLRANTVSQMEACLRDIFDLESGLGDPLYQGLQEAEEAIRQIVGGVPEVTLSPQNAYVRRRQHEMARDANLTSESRGNEPHRRVRIYREA
jgi:hypothetical protein